MIDVQCSPSLYQELLLAWQLLNTAEKCLLCSHFSQLHDVQSLETAKNDYPKKHRETKLRFVGNMSSYFLEQCSFSSDAVYMYLFSLTVYNFMNLNSLRTFKKSRGPYFLWQNYDFLHYILSYINSLNFFLIWRCVQLSSI